MSGGSLNYVYCRVADAASEIRDRSNDPLHLAFADHLELVAKALHDIEWLYSCDYGPGQERESIGKVVTPAAVERSCVGLLKELHEMIGRGIKVCETKS